MLLFVVLLITANLVVSNTLATTGEQLRSLHTRRSNLENQNDQLKQLIVKYSTLETVEERAFELGMGKVEVTRNLQLNTPVAMKQL